MKPTFLLMLFGLAYGVSLSQDNLGYQRPPEAIAKLVEAPLTPMVTLSI